MTNDGFLARLMMMDEMPCAEARRWIRSQPKSNLKKLWETCPRSDWMFWLVQRLFSVELEYEFYDKAVTKCNNMQSGFPTIKYYRQIVTAEMIETALNKYLKERKNKPFPKSRKKAA